jgi:hypothetical protein
MLPSGAQTLLLYQNRSYLAPELDASNRDFEYTYSAELTKVPKRCIRVGFPAVCNCP